MVVVGVRARVTPVVHERHRRLQFEFEFPAHFPKKHLKLGHFVQRLSKVPKLARQFKIRISAYGSRGGHGARVGTARGQ